MKWCVKHIISGIWSWKNQLGSYYRFTAVENSLVICELGIKLAFQGYGKDQMIHWLCKLSGLAPMLSPALARPELHQMFGRGLGEVSSVSINKFRQLRGGCHSALGNAAPEAHSTSSHGSCILLSAPLLLEQWTPQRNTAPLISLESLVSYTPLCSLLASQMVLVVNNPPASAEDIRDMGLIPGLGRSPG